VSTGARAHATTPALSRAYRLGRLIAHLVYGCTIAAVVFPLVSNRTQLRIIRYWSRRLLDILNVRLHVHGRMPGGHVPTMLVTNHVSWLDIWVIHSVSPVRFIAKSDIRRWPLLGWLVERAGTIFIQRTRRHDTARTNHAIGAVLARDERIGLFPEGTTTDGTHVLPFHASLFQPALAAGARIVAAGIRYPGRDGRPNLDAAYSGDRSLLESLRLILAQRQLHAELVFAGVVEPEGRTRRDVAVACRALIVHALSVSAPSGSPPGTAAGHRSAGR
jgi:1-acyl-sn-glycerol-3-phosphate acyltransferase